MIGKIHVGGLLSSSSLFLDQMAIIQCSCYSHSSICTYMFSHFPVCLLMFHNETIFNIQVKINCSKTFCCRNVWLFQIRVSKTFLYMQRHFPCLCHFIKFGPSEHDLYFHWLFSLLCDDKHYIWIWIVTASQKLSVVYQQHETFVCCYCK